MAEDVLLTRQIGYIRELTFNRPDRMNAVNRDLLKALREELEASRYDANTRILLLKGSGKAFCAGADLKERATMEQKEVTEFVTALRACMYLLYSHPKITVAQIDGFALGGGLEIALSCDMRYARTGIKLGLTETRLAIIPGAGGTQLLPRVIGVAKAKELIFKAQPIPAEEALSLGIVNHVLDAEDIDQRVFDDLEVIAGNGPVALTMAKKAINLGSEIGLEQALEVEKHCYDQLIPTQDRIEGLQAFKEKRKPQYRGC